MGGASASEDLHAPDLLPYELESALRSLVFARELTEAQAIEGLERIEAVPLTLHPHPDGGRLLRMAGRQETRLAYDSAYLVLTEGLAADLWTADRRREQRARARHPDSVYRRLGGRSFQGVTASI